MDNLATAIGRARGLQSQEAFAAKMGVTRQTVIQWEAGRSVPSYEAAQRLVDAGVSIDLFLMGRGANAAPGKAA